MIWMRSSEPSASRSPRNHANENKVLVGAPITATRLFRGVCREKVAPAGAAEVSRGRRSQKLHPERWLLYFLPMADDLSGRYRGLLTGSYDCVDRMVLNGYFRPGHSAGGFRIWWHNLTGTVETLDNTHLMRLAGRFSRRIRGWAKANGVPVIDCRGASGSIIWRKSISRLPRSLGACF